MKHILGLDENATITQHTLSGKSEARKKIMEQRSLPQNTPPNSTFRALPKSRKRQKDYDTADV
jgi:hypothetical protein